MLPFWDRFVLALYYGLALDLSAGRSAALRILDLAITRSRLRLPELNDTSLLLLCALLPGSSPHRKGIEVLVAGRGLHAGPTRLLELLRVAAPARWAELLAIYASSTPPLPGLVLAALLAPENLGVIENLRLYLARRFLINPDHHELGSLATDLLTRATQRFARMDLGTMSYPGYLYHFVLAQTEPGHDLPPLSPPSFDPPWYKNLPADEKRFINSYPAVEDDGRVGLLHLHFSARLDVAQIAEALNIQDEPQSHERIVQRIEEWWRLIL